MVPCTSRTDLASPFIVTSYSNVKFPPVVEVQFTFVLTMVVENNKGILWLLNEYAITYVLKRETTYEIDT